MSKFLGTPASEFLPKQRPIAPRERPLHAERPVAASRAVHAEPPEPPNLSGLYSYQVDGVKWLHQRKRALLADDMGIGKTCQTLRALPPGHGTIVVCPASLQLNWAREVYKFRPDLSVSLAGNTEHLKKSLLDEFFGKDPGTDARVSRFCSNIRKFESGTLPAPGSREVVIVSRDNLPDPPAVPAPRWLVPVPLGDVTLVLDEVQGFKNEYADRTQRVRLLGRQCGRRWGLTGTPMEGKPEDLWGVLETLGVHRNVFPGKNRKASYAAFLKAFGAKKQFFGGKFTGYAFGDEPVENVAAMLKPVMLRRLKRDVLPNLPPKVYVNHTIEISDELYAELDALDEAWAAEGHDKLPPFELFSEVRAKLAAARIPDVREFCSRYEEEQIPLVVFCSHDAPLLDLIGGDYGHPREGWGCVTGSTPAKVRDLHVELFQSGMLHGLAVATKAGGVGLTLTRAAHCLFVDLSYTPSENKQAEDRLVRIGQEAKSVQVTRMVANHAVDRRLLEILAGKETLIDATLGEGK